MAVQACHCSQDAAAVAYLGICGRLCSLHRSPSGVTNSSFGCFPLSSLRIQTQRTGSHQCKPTAAARHQGENRGLLGCSLSKIVQAVMAIGDSMTAAFAAAAGPFLSVWVWKDVDSVLHTLFTHCYWCVHSHVIDGFAGRTFHSSGVSHGFLCWRRRTNAVHYAKFLQSVQRRCSRRCHWIHSPNRYDHAKHVMTLFFNAFRNRRY